MLSLFGISMNSAKLTQTFNDAKILFVESFAGRDKSGSE